MSDRLWFTLAAAAAVLMIGLATVWPQGFGARSPGVFGHAAVVPTQPQKPTAAAAAARAQQQLGLDALSAAPSSPDPAGLRPSQ